MFTRWCFRGALALWAALVVSASASAASGGVVVFQAGPGYERALTVAQARSEFYRLFGQATVLSGNPKSEYWVKRMAKVSSVTLRPDGLEFTWTSAGKYKAGQTTSCTFDSLAGPVVRDHGKMQKWMRYGVHLGLECDLGLAFGSADDAVLFAKALYVLKSHQVAPEDPAAAAAFEEVARRYVAADPKPEFPEEARRFKVQAEQALDLGREDEALEKYAQALQIAPWWPEGHFNRGVLFGKMEFYPEAVRELKRYLALVPGAPDARAVQDKIYQWEALGSPTTVTPPPPSVSDQETLGGLFKKMK